MLKNASILFYNMSAHVDVDFFKAGGGGARMVFWIV